MGVEEMWHTRAQLRLQTMRRERTGDHHARTRSRRDAFAPPVALVSQVDGTVAISPVDVNKRFIPLERLELFVQFWRECKNEI